MDDSVFDALDRLHGGASFSINHHALFDVDTSFPPNFDNTYSNNEPFEHDDFSKSFSKQ